MKGKASKSNTQAVAYFRKLKKSKPEQLAKELIPELQRARKSRVQNANIALEGLISSIPNSNFGAEVPEWVVRASHHGLQLLGIDFNELEKTNSSELGKFFGLLEKLKYEKAPVKLKKASFGLSQIARREISKSPPSEARQFFAGMERAEKIHNGIKQPPQRIKVFLVIAAAWRQVQQFGSAGQLHRWLLEFGVIAGNTEYAETRKICRIIGLRFRTSGRPKNKIGPAQNM